MWLVKGDEAVASFYLGKAPVTNRQFEEFDPGHVRARASAGDDDPVCASLDEARRYCAWYAALANKPFRLPTEAEWTHADAGPPGARTNRLGLLDMGRIGEWTAEGSLRGGAVEEVTGFRVGRTL